jgi:colicin import membrane protein
MRLQEKKTRERQEALEKSWQERETRLKEQEDELARLRNESETFPKRLQQEIERAVVEATRQADERLQQQLLIAGKDSAADKRVAELQIETLEETVARRASQIAAMQKQLEEAKQQVQDIAVKAIEGASNARALTHVNQIAMEQAKQRGDRER